MKQMILMRHAKSDWKSPAADEDFKRPINDRGQYNARQVGEYFYKHQITPQAVFCSSAVRTHQTIELVMQQAQWQQKEPKVSLFLLESLYLCSADQLLDVVANSKDEISSLLVVSHQPTCANVVSLLVGKEVDFVTAAVANLSLNIDTWSDLNYRCGTLTNFVQPSQLPNLPEPL